MGIHKLKKQNQRHNTQSFQMQRCLTRQLYLSVWEIPKILFKPITLIIHPIFEKNPNHKEYTTIKRPSHKKIHIHSFFFFNEGTFLVRDNRVFNGSIGR